MPGPGATAQVLAPDTPHQLRHSRAGAPVEWLGVPVAVLLLLLEILPLLHLLCRYIAGPTPQGLAHSTQTLRLCRLLLMGVLLLGLPVVLLCFWDRIPVLISTPGHGQTAPGLAHSILCQQHPLLAPQ